MGMAGRTGQDARRLVDLCRFSSTGARRRRPRRRGHARPAAPVKARSLPALPRSDVGASGEPGAAALVRTAATFGGAPAGLDKAAAS